MSGLCLFRLSLCTMLLLALATQPPLSAPGLPIPFSGSKRVIAQARKRSDHGARPGVLAQSLAVLPDPAAIRAEVLEPDELFSPLSILDRALALLPKVSDILGSPKSTPAPGPELRLTSYLVQGKSETLPPSVTAQTPTRTPVLSLTLPTILMPFSGFIGSQITERSLLPTPTPLAPAAYLEPVYILPTALQTSTARDIATAASLVPVQTSTGVLKIPAVPLGPAQASTLPQIPVFPQVQTASSVPDQGQKSPLTSLLEPTQILTSMLQTLDASLVPTQTSQLSQKLAPSLAPIHSSSILPTTMSKKNPTIPNLPPEVSQERAVNMLLEEVSKLSQTSAPVVPTPTSTLPPAMPQAKTVPLVSAQIPTFSQTQVPSVEHSQILIPLLQLPQILVSDKAPYPAPQALEPTQTLAPPVPQKQFHIPTELLTQTLAPLLETGEVFAPPPEPTIPLAPPPEPPPKPTKPFPPSPKMTKVFLPSAELKEVPVSVLPSKSIQNPAMLLNNTSPSPPILVEEHQVPTTILPNLVSQESTQEINFRCLGPCSCKAGTLSCTGLSPELRLHSVPVPDPSAHNLTFSSLDFQGNFISAIEGGIWKAYPWTEILNLKDNALHVLHRNSFEGLLSLQYLDLSCNKIHVIERNVFEPLPFLQFLNLSCNLLQKLSYGTFQAWHGMQFLQKLILSRNPLSVIEDRFFFQLPSLTYLDIGRTEAPLRAIENILIMALRLQTLILPSNIACCLCQFKKEIESIFTIELECESKGFANSSLCDQKESIEDIQEEFINTLQARKNNTHTDLSLQPDSSYAGGDTRSSLNKQLSSNGEMDLLDIMNYLLPKLLKGQVQNVEVKISPLLSTYEQNGETPSDPSMTKTEMPTFEPIWLNLTDQIQLRKLFFVTNLLEAYLREKIHDIKSKHEKTANARLPTQEKCHGSSGKCSQQPAGNSSKAATPRMDSCSGEKCVEKRLVRRGEIPVSWRRVKKKHSQEIDQMSFQSKRESVKSSLENIAKRRKGVRAHTLRKPSSQLRKPDRHHGAQKSKIWIRNSLDTGASFSKNLKTPVSSFLKNLVSIPSSARPYAVSLKARNKTDVLLYPISALKGVSKRRKYKGQKDRQKTGTALQKDRIPILHSNKNQFSHKAKSHTASIFPEAKRNQKVKTKLSQNKWLFENPYFTKLTSLKNSSLFKKALSISPERSLLAKASQGTTPTKAFERAHTRNTSLKTTTAASVWKEEFTFSSSLSAVQQTNETDWKYQEKAEFLPESNNNSSSNFLTSDDSFEMELNQHLLSLIPNSALRSLISHVVRTLEKDCMEPGVQLACAKLISRTGLLLKLFSEQEKMKESSADQNSAPWKSETYLTKGTSVGTVQDEPKRDELRKDIPEFGYNNKLLLSVSVTVVVMIIIAVICLFEICSHRATSSESETKFAHRPWKFITSLHKKSPRESHEEDGNVHRKGKPLWLRDMYRPLDATRKKNMAQKLHDQDSSDEEEIFSKEERNEVVVKGKTEKKKEDEG